MGYGAICLALPLLMNMAGFTPAEAQVVCGAVITGDAVMTSDLICPINNPAVQVNGGSLDMNGHRIGGCPGAGIRVTGTGAKVFHGSVNGCIVGVDLLGAVGANITNVVATANTIDGFHAGSAAGGNKMTGCAALGNGATGFNLQATDANSIIRCTASTNGSVGFSVQGNGNQIRDSLAINNSGAGIDLNGTANNLTRNVLTNNNVGLTMAGSGKIADNRATSSTLEGFVVSAGMGPQLTKNVAAGNGSVGFDLVGQNVLKDNTAAKNGADGFAVAGTATTLNSCIANDNGGSGFEVGAGASANTLNASVAMGNNTDGVLLVNGAANNVVTKNVMLENGDNDARDNNTNCDGNQWSNNFLRTKEAGGVPGHTCIE